jgi:hypothetical protein
MNDSGHDMVIIVISSNSNDKKTTCGNQQLPIRDTPDETIGNNNITTPIVAIATIPSTNDIV